ncbi:MAG: HAMP domain-containing sensor histidine kinase, partial [Oscillospiraceae bacterium]
SLVLAFVLIALMLLSMLIPHKWLSWFKIPYEISLSICISVALFSFFGAPQFILDYLVSKNDFILELTMGNAKIADILIKTSHIIMWIIYYANAILTGFLLKSLFKKEYFKKTSLIYRFCHFVKTKYNRMIDKVIGIDISSNLTKIVVGFIVVNGIIVSLCCAGWFFGILGVVIYSIVLFFLGCKFIKSIRDRYNKVLDITKEIADGNLTVDTSEDLKNFNSLKDNLAKIQVGLKKSVKEAVESQKMKTDLITNVSHDLKTPLTSIISYVDLLKDENLSKEKRKEYIDILDKKAERLNILINDLFEASKASSGNVNLNIEKIDIVALIKQTINELEDKLQEIEIKTTFCDEKIILDLDSVCTFRIFSNLINNIAKYSLPNTRAYIDVTQDNE